MSANIIEGKKFGVFTVTNCLTNKFLNVQHPQNNFTLYVLFQPENKWDILSNRITWMGWIEATLTTSKQTIGLLNTATIQQQKNDHQWRWIRTVMPNWTPQKITLLLNACFLCVVVIESRRSSLQFARFSALCTVHIDSHWESNTCAWADEVKGRC